VSATKWAVVAGLKGPSWAKALPQNEKERLLLEAVTETAMLDMRRLRAARNR
jgi:hypothetical protein